MKNGYDRFAVDDAVEKYAAQVDELEKRIALYQQQAAEDAARLDDMQKKYNAVLQNMQAKQAAADDIARLSLREANEIISTAQNNADEMEALLGGDG